MAKVARTERSKLSAAKTKRARAPRAAKPRATSSGRSARVAAATVAPGHERSKTPSARSRVKRYLASGEPALREAVRIECLKQFERRLGRPWDPELERVLRDDSARRMDLQEAFEVHEQLRAAMARAVEFVKRPRAYAAPLGLGSWVP